MAEYQLNEHASSGEFKSTDNISGRWHVDFNDNRTLHLHIHWIDSKHFSSDVIHLTYYPRNSMRINIKFEANAELYDRIFEAGKELYKKWREHYPDGVVPSEFF